MSSYLWLPSASVRCVALRNATSFLDYLKRSPKHPTAEEIYKTINRNDPRASLATVYKSLHAMALAGLIREVTVDGSQAVGSADRLTFHHFQYDCRTGENHFPCNVYPKDLQQLRKQLNPLKRYAVKIEESEVWVDLQ